MPTSLALGRQATKSLRWAAKLDQQRSVEAGNKLYCTPIHSANAADIPIDPSPLIQTAELLGLSTRSLGDGIVAVASGFCLVMSATRSVPRPRAGFPSDASLFTLSF